MSSIDLYLYYGGEPCSDVTYGVIYEGPGKKLEIIQLKKWREINLKKLKKTIMKELDLDRRLYDIKIIYRAPHVVFNDRIVFTSIKIKGDKHVKIILDRINFTTQLKATELYISVEHRIEVSGEVCNKQLWRVVVRKNSNHYMRIVIRLLPRAPQLGVIHYHVKRHQLQWRFADLVINKNVFNL